MQRSPVMTECQHKRHTAECYTTRIRDLLLLGLNTREIYSAIYTVDGITHRIKYHKSITPKNRFTGSLLDSLHMGQRKLLISEIMFLSNVLKSHDEHAIVVYPGSSPNNKLGILRDLFPNVTFLLIDPEEAIIHIDNKFTTHYADTTGGYVYLSYHNSSSKKVTREIVNYYNGESVVRCTKAEMSASISQEAIDYVFESDPKCFIIENFFDHELAAMIRSAMDRSGKNILFISDIRTVGILDEQCSKPSDSDVMFNAVQMFNWLREIQPIWSMVKFRPPYNDKRFPILWNHPLFQAELAMALEPIRGIPGFDFHQHFRHHGCIAYFDNMTLNLQAHAGKSSTEVRAILSADALKLPLISYDSVVHEEKMQFYNKIFRTAIKSFNGLWETDPEACKAVGMDLCGDCSIEARAIEDYCAINPNANPFEIIRRISISTGRHLSNATRNAKTEMAHGKLY